MENKKNQKIKKILCIVFLSLLFIAFLTCLGYVFYRISTLLVVISNAYVQSNIALLITLGDFELTAFFAIFLVVLLIFAVYLFIAAIRNIVKSKPNVEERVIAPAAPLKTSDINTSDKDKSAEEDDGLFNVSTVQEILRDKVYHDVCQSISAAVSEGKTETTILLKDLLDEAHLNKLLVKGYDVEITDKQDLTDDKYTYRIYFGADAKGTFNEISAESD